MVWAVEGCKANSWGVPKDAQIGAAGERGRPARRKRLLAGRDAGATRAFMSWGGHLVMNG